MDIKEREWDITEWIDLALGRSQWKALVITVMNDRVHKMLAHS
jgi:hypothetical protein